MIDAQGERRILPSISDIQSYTDQYPEDQEKEISAQILQSNIKSNLSSQKLLKHQEDRYQIQNIQKVMCNQNYEREQESISELMPNQKQKDLQQSSSILKRGRNPLKLPPLKALKSQELASRVKFMNAQELTKSRNSDSLMMSLEKLKLKTKYKTEEVEDFHEFCKDFIPSHKFFIGTLKRNRGGLNRFFPIFDLHFTDQLKFLMSSKRQFCHQTSSFFMNSQKANQCLGRVRSNFTGTLYNIYSQGPAEEIIATVIYKSTLSCSDIPRQIQIYLLSPYYSYEQLAGVEEGKNLKQLYQIRENSENKRIIKLVNKKPKWSQGKKCWYLNFRGKAQISSVKNMIIVDADTQQKQSLLVGKSEENTFNVEINHPFSPRVAIAILCTSFDFKWISQ